MKSMNGVNGKTVLITGGSSGIGRSCAWFFAEEGAKVIMTSRKLENVELAAREIGELFSCNILPLELDVRNREEVERQIGSLPEKFADIDILVNNAGLALGLDKVHEGDTEDWDTMIDTNVKGLLYMTRMVVPGMVERGYGHVINIGSTAGIHAYPGGAVYCATKTAVRFISDGLRMDLVDKPVRVTNIQPGMTETNFSNVRFKGDTAWAARVYEGLEALTADDIAHIVLYTASVPEHVQIQEVTVTPNSQATGGVVHRDRK